MEDKISEKFCKGKEFVDCMFVNRNWDCNRDSCPLSKNKTKDVKKHIGRIMKETKLQGRKERNAEVKQEIIKWSDENLLVLKSDVNKLLQKLGLEK